VEPVRAPLGVVYDLTGDGRTVLKGNYGFFWHNPGVGIGGAANPNTAGKSAVYSWNDVNGDRRWQPGEEGNLISASLQGAVSARPRHQGAVHARGERVGRAAAHRHARHARRLRLQDGRRPDLDVWQPFRPASAFTVPFTFVDIGVTACAARRRPQHHDVRHADRAGRALPDHDGRDERGPVRALQDGELSVNKRYSNRWSASIGGAHTWMTDFPNGFPQRNPNNPALKTARSGTSRSRAATTRPYGIRISPVLRHQSGANYARTVTIS
jgi:hypothetical protein